MRALLLTNVPSNKGSGLRNCRVAENEIIANIELAGKFNGSGYENRDKDRREKRQPSCTAIRGYLQSKSPQSRFRSISQTDNGGDKKQEFIEP
jgi:hypothetical protein